MAEATDRGRQVWRGLALVAIAAGFIRIVAAVVAGIATAGDHPAGVPGRVFAGQTMEALGAGGGFAGAVIAVAAAGFATLAAARLATIGALARVLVVAVAASIVVGTIGDALIASTFGGDPAVANLSRVLGEGIAALAICLGGAVSVNRMPDLGSAAADDMQQVIFAVDRVDGEVFVARSFAGLARVISIYSIEDDEFEFFTLDGHAVLATAADGRAAFDVTDDNRLADLLPHLRRFATAKELHVTPENRDDPTAYVAPIEEWQALELWPPWLRPIGRLVRALR